MLLNVIVLFIGACAAYFGAAAAAQLTALKLHRTGHAPLLIEGDPYLQRAIHGVRRARGAHSVPMLFVTLLTGSLLAAELSAELGLNTSSRCKPRRILTAGICAKINTDDMEIIEKFTSASVALTMWPDAELKHPVRQGFRNTFDGSESLDENLNPADKNLPIVISGVSVSSAKTHSPSNSNYTVSFVERVYNMRMITSVNIGASRSIDGIGRETQNGNYTTGFIIAKDTSPGAAKNSILLLDFPKKNSVHENNADHHAEHEGEIHDKEELGTRLVGDVVKELNVPIVEHKVTIENTGLTQRHLLDALVAFRLVQLQNPVNVHPVESFKAAGQYVFPKALTASDIVRALISAKAVGRIGAYVDLTFCRYYSSPDS